jgi:hypothetical protein
MGSMLDAARHKAILLSVDQQVVFRHEPRFYDDRRSIEVQ